MELSNNQWVYLQFKESIDDELKALSFVPFRFDLMIFGWAEGFEFLFPLCFRNTIKNSDDEFDEFGSRTD